jgi:hypothetical protein
MIAANGCHAETLWLPWSASIYDATMSPTITEESTPAATRVLAVVLTEEEWSAFRAIEPQPLEWLQQQIRARVEKATAAEDEDY